MNHFTSGSYSDQGFYKSFQPTFINREWSVDDIEVISLLSRADRMLGQLDMISEHIPNTDLFIRMHVTKEATQSTRIEGTRTNISEAIRQVEDLPLDRRDDWIEVQNYIKAMNEAVKMLDRLPFSSRLIKQVHKILMSGARGGNKQPGEFRSSQNWIGGANINEALFVPPISTSIAELMSDIEKFAHSDRVLLPELLKIALIHYQFETIHPFLDGNGRTGRLMITLYLVSKGVLKHPILYLSDYLEKHRSNYYSALMNVRTNNDIAGWFKFFLNGVIATAESGISTFGEILELQRENEEIAKSLGSKSTNVIKVLEALYISPVIDAKSVANVTGVSVASAYALVSDMERCGLLSEVTGNKRERRYLLTKYFNIFNK